MGDVFQNWEKKYLVARGKFKNSLKNGRFEYFNFHNGKISFFYEFLNGELHGRYVSFINDRIDGEGYYQFGKRDGYFIEYYRPQLGLRRVSHFKHDTLIHWIEYDEKSGLKLIEGFGDKKFINGTYYVFDSIGYITKSYVFEKSKQIKYIEYYPKLNSIKIIAEGMFLNCSQSRGNLCDIKPINGIVTYFDVYGNPVEVEEFIEGIKR